ncbi:probable G-protein coupled receptor 139 [Pollicipes pollicipes]|uniref:probable G-protein coupled receptor 139 n=1 Tax=Pollicipes pollicipes TaxID=41117 RepID=UPI001884EF34|nr:probable G-protein coupled receptor 139 [Pollicipes pollicipes]
MRPDMSMNIEVRTNAQAFLHIMLKRMNLTLSDWEAFTNQSGVSDDLGDTTAARSEDICGEGVRWLRDSYRPLHGYLALVVCVFGSVANLINIVVLTRKDMLSSTNIILTGLAVADMAVMLEYIPFAFQHYIEGTDQFSYPAIAYVLFHAHFAQVFHTVSIFMTVMLAVWRFLSIVHPALAVHCCTMKRSIIFIVAAYLVSPIICIPSYFTFAVHSRPAGGGTILYSIDISDVGRRHHGLLNRANFWLYSVLIKLAPCLALTYFSIRLIRVLLETKRRKQRLMTGCRVLSADHHLVQGTRQTDRTTRVLVAVLLLFLLTEFPQGILALLSGILQDRFFRTCYLHVGELLDILALTNSAVNFLLYCLMSKQFRDAFRSLLRPLLRSDRRRLQESACGNRKLSGLVTEIRGRYESDVPTAATAERALLTEDDQTLAEAAQFHGQDEHRLPWRT